LFSCSIHGALGSSVPNRGTIRLSAQ
jgi:hypothetical protein